MTNRTSANYQDLFKTIAIICMIIDHVGLFVVHEDIMRVVGRVAMPIFGFFAGYNFTKPRHQVLALGLALMFIEVITFRIYGNILLIIYLGQQVLRYAQKYTKKDSCLVEFIICILALLLTPLTYQVMDFGTLIISFMVVGGLYRDRKEIPGFMPLVCLSFILFMLMTFYAMSLVHLVIASLLVSITCYILSRPIHEKPISIDLRFISRNALIIYFVHIVILIIIVFYGQVFINLYK